MTFLNIILGIGIPSILAAFVYIGRKLQVLDTPERDFTGFRRELNSVNTRLTSMDSRLTKVEFRLGAVEGKVDMLENKVDLLWKTAK